jgi:hypothetical protein
MVNQIQFITASMWSELMNLTNACFLQHSIDFRMTNSIATVDFDDTFLSYDHLVASFPNYKVTNTIDNEELLVPPFRYDHTLLPK